MKIPAKIDRRLPWGYWLRLEHYANEGERFIDSKGKAWTSLRQAFWCGRLGMPAYGEGDPDTILELMLAMLIGMARDEQMRWEIVADVFGRNHLMYRFLDHWMRGVGLLRPYDPSRAGRSEIASEGWSAMLMLGATRPQPVRAVRPTSISIRTLLNLGVGALSSEERMREVEDASASWPAAFLHQTVGDKPMIVLVKRDVEAPVPVTRTAWSQGFSAVLDRDALYDWLCRRVDRWEDWAKLAWTGSGAELTGHLLSMVVLSQASSD